MIGTGWAGAWVILGLWLMENYSPLVGVGPITAGMFVLMALVADDLVPEASPTVTGIMKLTMAFAFYGWAPLVFWSFWNSTPT